MKDFARDFYRSKEWKKVSTAYMTSRFYLCERCGSPATICHHKIYLNAQNINDPEISLNPDRLECLCQDCHNKEHSLKRTITRFDDSGNIVGVKKSGDEKQFERDRDAFDEALKKMTAQNGSESIFRGRGI